MLPSEYIGQLYCRKSANFTAMMNDGMIRVVICYILFIRIMYFLFRISEYHPRKYYQLLELRHLLEINKIGNTIRGYDNFLLGLLVKQQTVEMEQLR